jgi:hypothetical protein
VDNHLFLSEEQRLKLVEALKIIQSVYNETTIEHEEYSILYTTLDALERAIEYKERM